MIAIFLFSITAKSQMVFVLYTLSTNFWITPRTLTFQRKFSILLKKAIFAKNEFLTIKLRFWKVQTMEIYHILLCVYKGVHIASLMYRPWWEKVHAHYKTLWHQYFGVIPFIPFSCPHNNFCFTYTIEMKLRIWIGLKEIRSHLAQIAFFEKIKFWIWYKFSHRRLELYLDFMFHTLVLLKKLFLSYIWSLQNPTFCIFLHF